VTDHRELCPINFGNTVANAVSNLITGLLGSLLGTVNSVIGTNVNVLCSGQGEKRVIVAVLPARAGNRAGVVRPVYLSAMIANPTLGISGL
jgi:hypothetical protein